MGGRRLIHVSESTSPNLSPGTCAGRIRWTLDPQGWTEIDVLPAARSAGRAVPGPRIGEITGPAAAGRAAAQATGPPRTSTTPGLFSHDMSA